jgi:hypothetical protein
VVSDDTRLLRAMAAKHRIRLHPEFCGIYSSPRTSLRDFAANAHYRGETFVDSYWESPSAVGRATRLLPMVVPLALVAAVVTARHARSAPAAVGAAAAVTPSLATAVMASVGGKPLRQGLTAAAIAPAFSAFFGSGLVKGYVSRSPLRQLAGQRRTAGGE